MAVVCTRTPRSSAPRRGPSTPPPRRMFAAVSETRPIVQDPVQGPLWISDDRCDGFSAWMRTDGERTRMDIKGINGGDGVHPLRVAQGAQPASSSSGDFARVFDLAEARRQRMTRADRIPEEVWD